MRGPSAPLIAFSPDGKHELRMARRYWKDDPLNYRCAGFLAELMNSRLTIECEDEAFRDVVEIWLKHTMGHTFRDQFFRELVVTGMVPVLKTLIPYKPREYRYNRAPRPGTEDGNVEQRRLATGEEKSRELAAASDAAFKKYRDAYARWEKAKWQHEQHCCSAERLKVYEQAVATAQYAWLPTSVPGAYTILDPLAVDMDGPAEMAWLREPHLRVSGDLRKAIENPTPGQLPVISQLPVEIVKQIREGKHKVWLSPNICCVVFMDKQPYEKYPTPIARHCFDALAMKKELLDMDRTTARTVKNRILKVTVGNDNFPVTDPQEMVRLSAQFANTGRNMTIFWNHTLAIEWIQPDTKEFVNKDKYAFVNDEIRTAYGILPLFTGGIRRYTHLVFRWSEVGPPGG